MDSKVVRKVLVGIVLEKYFDEGYFRDRDIVVPLHEGETDTDAIKLWCEEMKGWMRPDEKRYVKVIRTVGLKEWAGHEMYRG